MPGPILHVGAVGMCPHAGQMTIIATNRVLLGGQPAATISDTFLIAGCPFNLGPGGPHPCVTVRWLVPAMRVTISGQPAVTMTSVGLCLAPDQVPQGPPMITSAQPRASAT